MCVYLATHAECPLHRRNKNYKAKLYLPKVQPQHTASTATLQNISINNYHLQYSLYNFTQNFFFRLNIVCALLNVWQSVSGIVHIYLLVYWLPFAVCAASVGCEVPEVPEQPDTSWPHHQIAPPPTQEEKASQHQCTVSGHKRWPDLYFCMLIFIRIWNYEIIFSITMFSFSSYENKIKWLLCLIQFRNDALI